MKEGELNDAFQKIWDTMQAAPKVYTLPVGDPLKKALARHEWKERYRAKRILSRPPKFATR